MIAVSHASNGAHRPGLAHARPVPGTRVQGACAEDLDALALREALSYRRGGDKLDVLALRFAMRRADVSAALNGHDRTPGRILARLTLEESATYYRVRAEAVEAARRVA